MDLLYSPVMTSAHEPAKGAELLTPVQARRRLGISPRTLQRWVASGRITPAARLINGHKRFAPEDVEALIERRVSA